ncbi:hypothetical protein BH23ACT3_BH23ACT3_14170 [soil metagenome]
MADLSLFELAEFDGIVLVEWCDVAGASRGDHLEIRLGLDPESDDEHLRTIELTAAGRSWASRWDRLNSALEPYRW